MKSKRFCWQVINKVMPLSLMMIFSLNTVPVFAQQGDPGADIVYFFHLNGPYTDIFDSTNTSIYQQGWTSRGERLIKNYNMTLTEKKLLKKGLPVRYTPRGIKLFDSRLQLTNGGLYSEPLKMNP